MERMSESTRRHRLRPLVLAAVAVLLAAPAHGQSMRTIHSSRQLLDRKPLDVEVRYGAGELQVAPTSTSLLYEMELRYDEQRFTPLSEYDAEAGKLRLGVQGKDRRKDGSDLREGSRASIALTREVPLDLDLEFGAGEADIELGGLRLRRLELSTGASDATVRFSQPNPVRASRVSIEAGAAELRVVGLGNARTSRIDFQGGVGSTVLDFSGEWAEDASASVQIGVGSVTLRLPRGLGVRVNKSSFLASFDADGFTRRGSTYYSPDWETARQRLTIDIQAALGSIEVEWIR